MKKGILTFFAALSLLSVGQVVHASVNDFTISSFSVDYYLSRDSEHRSTLKTVEKITAEFPQINQNHGLERAIPTRYDGHSTSLKIVSVTDGSGAKLTYSTNEQNDNKILRIGDADTYVHGTQTYVITYEQRDVTRYFADTNDDEFYWDVNGIEWRVPITSLRATLHVDPSIRDRLNGKTACYQGVSGSTNRCVLSGKEGTYQLAVSDLSSGENVTIAVGYAPETFTAYTPSFGEKLASLWGAVSFATGAIAIGIIIWILAKYNKLQNRTNEIGTIVPEYIPPRDASVTAVAEVTGVKSSVMTAQLLDLAVRHYIKIYQTREKSLWRSAEYDLEIIKPLDDLKWEEKELLSDLFASNISVGSRLVLKTLRNNTALYKRTRNNDGDFKKRVEGEYALRSKDIASAKWFKRIGWIGLIFAIVLVSIPLLIMAIIAFVMGAVLTPLTDKGLALRRYGFGLKDYISVAETERINMLQSPEGAAKVGESVDPQNPSQLIKLYERVLPYAVLFGYEKQWNKQLGQFYEQSQTQPDWYSGNSTAFNAAMFTSAMSGFSSSAQYTSSSSSSSGGSSGGGSSGGGGGGGGGGW